MNIAAYCRVSTDKADQLGSLEAQKAFFADYCARNNHQLVRIYADEGISGTKMKNRKQFLRLLEDAQTGCFEMVVVKDISRFARNTVDLLQSIRTLKALGIETVFLTASQTVLGHSEFVLTIFGALAQEESANTSKRVKFGKRLNAEKGRVPNLVYGYDKTPGDLFHLALNETEAEIIRQIYHWYNEEGFGAGKIAGLLNARGHRTKRNCRWSQNAVCRILQNPLYTGQIINGKEEVADFLTGVRKPKAAEEWLVSERPELRIIGPETFAKAGQLMAGRGAAMQAQKTRQNSRHLFSTLLRCESCGYAFRRLSRRKGNAGGARWVCSRRNGRGVDACPNATAVEEEVLIQALNTYFVALLAPKPNLLPRIQNEAAQIYRQQKEGPADPKEIEKQLQKQKAFRQKWLDLYTGEQLTSAELDERMEKTAAEIRRLEGMLAASRAPERQTPQERSQTLFPTLATAVDCRHWTNAAVKAVVDRIVVGADGKVAVRLKE